MKLRIRSLETKETLKIELSPLSPSLQHLRTAIADKISSNPQSLHISLNRKDELIPSSNDEESLQSLGITSGDLIFYTLNPSAFSEPPIPSPIPQTQSPQPEITSNQNQTLKPEPSSSQSNTPTSDATQTLTVAGQEGETMDVDQDDETPMDEDEISDPFPSFLKRVFKEEAIGEGDSKLLTLALHAALLESGFVGFDSLTKKEINRIPSTYMGLQYTLPNLPKPETVNLKIQEIGNFVNVYGSLKGRSANVYKLCLMKSNFAPSISFAYSNSDPTASIVSFHVKQVFMFWTMVKDKLALPLLIDLCEVGGFSLPPCFMCLPTEVKLKILELLPGVDVAKVGCVSSEMKFLSSSDDLWKQKVEKEFPRAIKGKQIDNWKKEYASFFRLKRKLEQPTPRMPMHMPNQFRFPSRGGLAPFGGRAPFGFPGVIGGDYDLFPAVPSPFRSTPGLRFISRGNVRPPCNLGGFDT